MCVSAPTAPQPTHPPTKKQLTVYRELRIAITAAMKKVLSPISDAPMTPIALISAYMGCGKEERARGGQCCACARRRRRRREAAAAAAGG
jgi:hypothetical protein